ncbi:MAG: fibronectin type III domain-containing protein, partial [Thermoguttaceae bacterium]|nr:fibronectin type III domain-containing protein [Thermoguttaceae bacterium]
TAYPSPGAATVTYQWYRSKTASNWTAIDGATKKTYKPTADDQGYYLRIVVKGTGSYTGQVVKATAKKIAAPSVKLATPSGFKAEMAADSATLSWSNVANASSYTLEYKESSASTYTVIQNAVSPYVIANLTPGVSYDFRVKAIGSGTYTNSSYATVTAATASSASAASQIFADFAAELDEELYVFWDALESTLD